MGETYVRVEVCASLACVQQSLAMLDAGEGGVPEVNRGAEVRYDLFRDRPMAWEFWRAQARRPLLDCQGARSVRDD